MSAENVENIREGYQHFVATHQFREELMAPDFVRDMSTFRGWPERQIYPGIEGAKEFLDNWIQAWEDWEFRVESLHDAGEKVVAVVHQRGRAKPTGLPVEMRFAQVWTLRDGKQVRMEMYANPQEALRASGLGD